MILEMCGGVAEERWNWISFFVAVEEIGDFISAHQPLSTCQQCGDGEIFDFTSCILPRWQAGNAMRVPRMSLGREFNCYICSLIVEEGAVAIAPARGANLRM